jgi:hypothetical protein
LGTETYSLDNDTTTGVKRKRITALTIGNKFKFQQQNDPIVKNHILSDPKYNLISDQEALAYVNGMYSCCSKSKGIGCFALIFQHNNCVNYNDCIKHFRLCREMTQNLTIAEKTIFVGDIYKTSVAEVGNKLAYMLYGKQVCRKTIITVYGFSKFFFDQCIQNIKAQGKNNPNVNLFLLLLFTKF